jgi:hypothetical protein
MGGTMAQQRGKKQRSHASQPEIDHAFHTLGLDRPEDREKVLAPISYERPIPVPHYYAIKVSGSADETVPCYEAVVNA